MAKELFPRHMHRALLHDLELYPVVALMGARQVGKSTLCQQIARQRGMVYRTLDDRDVLEQARTDPEGLLHEMGNGGAFIDEVQRAPNLFLAIKTVVDREQKSGHYLISGSSQPQVRQGVGDSLLGRAAYRTLRPLTLSELRFDDIYQGWSFLFEESEDEILQELRARADSSGPLKWEDAVTTGGFPRAVSVPAADRLRMLNDYLEVFADRDIREVIGIESTDRFEPFLRLVVTLTGQELNMSRISRDLGISINTVRRWIDALKRSYLIETVPSYSRNASSRVVSAPKLFAVDSAFAIAGAQIAEPTGFHLENLIATDICVWTDEAPNRALYHWRQASGQEVDFVLEEKAKLLPIEVKCASTVSRNDTRHLRTFIERYPAAKRALLLSSDDAIRMISPNVIAAPWWAVI